MDQHDLETRVRNIDERTQRIEQILPTLATKEDLQGFATREDPKGFATKDDLKSFATKDDLKSFATKDDLKSFATKDDLKAFATKEDLKAFATKDDLKAYPTRDEMAAAIREEGVLTRAHFDVVAEDLKEGIKVIAEGHKAIEATVDNLGVEIRKELKTHDHRIMKLEAESLKRKL